ncbi:hypothetical protein BELL_1070g00010 [Botrytis elliptica]|uniref:Uncharacterized protein n=1 Tax=Botrytis elliptica TaxID=278938 RepID=A0A4Z1IQJ2_9HELO|nr:hypothetical protein BELL_1070g00010 [Botrytis elliptica]
MVDVVDVDMDVDMDEDEDEEEIISSIFTMLVGCELDITTPESLPPECMIMGYPAYKLRKGNRFDWSPTQKRNITNFIINNPLKKEQCGKGKKDQIPRSQMEPLFSELRFDEFIHMINTQNESIWDIVEEKIRNREHIAPARAGQQPPFSGSSSGSSSGSDPSHIPTITTTTKNNNNNNNNNNNGSSIITRLRSNAARGNAENQKCSSCTGKSTSGTGSTARTSTTSTNSDPLARISSANPTTNSNGTQRTQETAVPNINPRPEDSINPFSDYSEQQRREIRLGIEEGRRVQVEDEPEDQNYGQCQNAAASVAGENNNGGLMSTVFKTMDSSGNGNGGDDDVIPLSSNGSSIQIWVQELWVIKNNSTSTTRTTKTGRNSIIVSAATYQYQPAPVPSPVASQHNPYCSPALPPQTPQPPQNPYPYPYYPIASPPQ